MEFKYVPTPTWETKPTEKKKEPGRTQGVVKEREVSAQRDLLVVNCVALVKWGRTIRIVIRNTT